ncbi:MAG: Hpt domain-containing protein [Prolixibacteraceae bacterium]|jgi:HPt (histidine-containing phosphotransfer) domain-containing protein|nr:Hpt domain-containing protein [Prolixibacteraceae bacterium]
MTYTDLKYLKTITDGNNKIVREMIELFIMQIPDFINNMNRLYQSGQYQAMGKEAHKAKSSLQIMGMTKLVQEMKQFQLKTIEGVDVESYPVHIRNFEIQCEAAIKELQAELATL